MDSSISRETFEGMDDNSKLNVLYDLSKSSCEYSQSLHQKFERLEKRFERRKRIDTTIAGSTGFLGGVVVWLVKIFLGEGK